MAANNGVSPSQVGTKRGCWRKWWYSRNRPRVQKPSAAAGELVHKVLEHWMRDAVPPDPNTPEGRCALPGLPYLPLPGVAAVELRLDMPHEGVHYNGRIDYLYGYEPARVVIVGDHKTTGDFKWVKTSAQLLVDPQRIIYSRWAAITFGVPYVLANWTYYRRGSKPAARSVTLCESAAAIELRFRDLHRRDGLPILAAKSLTHPDSFPRNLSHCSAFGGCEHRGECLANVNPVDIAVGAMTE